MAWRLTTGFAAGTLPVARDDVMRVLERGDERAIILANASSAPFELIAPPLSRAMLDVASAAWHAGARPATAIAHGGEPLVTADAPVGPRPCPRPRSHAVSVRSPVDVRSRRKPFAVNSRARDELVGHPRQSVGCDIGAW